MSIATAMPVFGNARVFSCDSLNVAQASGYFAPGAKLAS